MPRKSWWARLPFGVRMTAGASALLVVIGAGTAGVAALTSPDQPGPGGGGGNDARVEPAAAPPPPPIVQQQLGAQAVTELTDSRRSDVADRTGTRTPRTPAT